METTAKYGTFLKIGWRVRLTGIHRTGSYGDPPQHC